MTTNVSVSEAVEIAIKKVKPAKVKKDGTLKVSRETLMELQLRVKNML